MNKDRVIMFGASIGGKQFLSYAKENDKYEILAIADNDKSKQNTLFCGIPVIDPKRISDYEYDFIIITSMYIREIREQLLNEFKISPLKIKETPKSITDPKKTYRAFEDKKTLDLARDVLLFIIDMFEQNNITYFIDHGTLLGIVREGDLIKWDDDIDLSIYLDDIDRTISCLKSNISKFPMNEKLDWKATVRYRGDGIPNSIRITFNRDNDRKIKSFPIDITGLYFENGVAIQNITYAPECHFRINQYIDYRGKSVSVPNNYEKYLDFEYGDWKHPKKDINFSDINNYKESVIKYEKDMISK